MWSPGSIGTSPCEGFWKQEQDHGSALISLCKVKCVCLYTGWVLISVDTEDIKVKFLNFGLQGKFGYVLMQVVFSATQFAVYYIKNCALLWKCVYMGFFRVF